MLNLETVIGLMGFDIHDGSITDVSWIEDKLRFTILGCGVSTKKAPEITLCFYGVRWIRSLCDELHDGYIKNTELDEYPLIDREKLNADYIEFVSTGLLDNVTFLSDNIVCFNDIFFFECTDVSIV